MHTLFKNYIEVLKSISLFEALSEKEILEILDHMNGQIVTYKKGDLICKESQCLLYIGIVLTGKLEMTQTCISQDIIFTNILTPYKSFGENFICRKQLCFPYSIKALQNTKLLTLNTQKLFQVTSRTQPYMSKLLYNLMKCITEQNIDFNKQLNYIQITSLTKRVAIFLLDYSQNAGAHLFTIPFNREEMALYLNATRPSLSKVLAELKRNGIIDYYKNTFKINDIDYLTTH